MAKKDIANKIVEEFPDKGFDTQQLIDSNSEKELVELQEQLRSEKENEDQNNVTTSQAELAEQEGSVSIEVMEETEKTAEEVIKSVAEGQEVTGKYKLADPKTHYAENYENEDDFTLVGDQEKELPKEPSPLLIERIRSGFIVKV